MDPSHPSLSHQAEIALSLSFYFNQVYILSASNKMKSLPKNIKIYNYSTNINFVLFKIMKFLFLFIYLLFRNNFDCVFSHMSSRHSLLMGPFLKFRNKKHVLWYAHTSNPLSLKFAYKFVDFLITSTKGSCPLRGDKVKYIGQSIDTNKFSFVDKQNENIKKFVHLGRFDRSKNIELIISEFSKFHNDTNQTSLTIIGTPSKKSSLDYQNSLRNNYADLVNSGSLKFLPAIKRELLPTVLSEYDLFLHAYIGSLDKVILEATLVGVPVATLNQEYLTIFGTWSKIKNTDVNLESEISSILKLSSSEIQIDLKNRSKIASNNHSIQQWINKVQHILNN